LSERDLARAWNEAPRRLTHHRPLTPKEALSDLATFATPGAPADTYGEGGPLEHLEARLATLLGKEAVAFMPSGTMAQQIALRIWTDRATCRSVAFHPTCHLALHEAQAYVFLHGLRGVPLGPATALMRASDVATLAEPVAALLIELPQREIGAQLLEWSELLELCAAARARGIKLHLDGARLWEAQAYYRRPHAEIAALFDTVYVSFYKGIGAIAGAALAGDAGTIAEARVWQHRHGGRLVSIYPLALSVERGLDLRLERMARYREAALRIADALRPLDGIKLLPDPPQTNTFHVFLPGERETLEARTVAIARERGTAIARRFAPSGVPGFVKWEFVAGDATLEFEPDEVSMLVRELTGATLGSAQILSAG
jgi:threonine aldolase